MIVDVYIEGQRLDLYKDEGISVTSSSQDINDISKLYADFSQSFTVPASRRNNQIFKQYYNADITGGYDARLRKDATIDINTLDFKRGKMRLDEVKVEQGVPKSYRITFFGNAIKLKDDISDDKLADLDWLDNFDHGFNDTNVENGLTTGLDFTVDSVGYDNAIIYPLISYGRQYLINTDSSDTTATTDLVNIDYDAARSDGIDISELKPAIKLSVIVKAIEEKYGFNFSGSFFNSSRFDEIYMNLNKTTESLNKGLLVVEDTSGVGYDESSLSEDKYRYSARVTPKAGFESVDYKIRLYINDREVYGTSGWISGTELRKGYLERPTYNFTARFEVETEESFEFDAETNFSFRWGSSSSDEIFDNTYADQEITLNTTITRELPDIKVIDFLNSLIKTFNLIVRPSGDDIYIEDLQTWYTEGNIYDITPYVDTMSETIKRGKIYKEINWQFEDSEQILANQYKTTNRQTYGNLEFKLDDGTGTLLSDVDGDKLDIDVLFENPIFERLNDLDDSSESDIQYCLYRDKSLEALVGNPFLFYAPVTTGVSLGFIGTSQAYKEITSVIMPSHSKDLGESSFNLNFNSVINEYTSEVYTDTIFQRYYEDYITDMFSVKRRIYDYKSILPDWLLSKIKLNDRLIIKDRRYIINKMTSNLVDRSDTLELINDIYDAPLASDTLNTSLFTPSSSSYSAAAQSDSTQYIGLSGKTISLVDTGDGTSWITLDDATTTSVIFEVGFSLDANTGQDRSAQIQVTDGINDPKFTIVQSGLGGAILDFSNEDNLIHMLNLINLKQ